MIYTIGNKYVKFVVGEGKGYWVNNSVNVKIPMTDILKTLNELDSDIYSTMHYLHDKYFKRIYHTVMPDFRYVIQGAILDGLLDLLENITGLIGKPKQEV